MAEEAMREITKEDIEPLPRWARVAFAARCARRVLPLFKHFWPEAPAQHLQALETACALLQAAAASPGRISGGQLRNARAACRAAADAAVGSAKRAAAPIANILAAAAEVGDAACDAAADDAAAAAANDEDAETYAAKCRASAAAADARASLGAVSTSSGVGRVVNDASYADGPDADAALRHQFAAVIRRDVEQLAFMATADGWTNNTGVDADLLGPLWPEGEPEGWPSEGDNSRFDAAPLKLFFSSEEYSPAQIAGMIKVLSMLYKEVGGDRLIIDHIGVLEMQHSPLEVC